MSFSSVLGHGTYQSVLAGVQRAPSKLYFNLGYQYWQLHVLNQDVIKKFAIRDKIFQNKFPEAAAVNGLFQMTSSQRHQYHAGDVMPSIRQRTFMYSRILQQRKINNEVLKDYEDLMKEWHEDPSKGAEIKTQLEDEQPLMKYVQSTSPDALKYFQPKKYTASRGAPNFWQNKERLHLIPKVHWERHPELGGITRVHRQLPRGTHTF